MIFFAMIVFALAFCGMSFSKPNEFNKDYLSIKTTNSIKGIFVLLIFLSHVVTYVKVGGPYDDPYTSMQMFLNQLIVVMIFFYSGYGMMESYKKKGTDYIKSIPYYRFFRLLLNFWLAIIPFVIVSIILKDNYPIDRILLAFIGWKTIGNSCWYMFAIFVMYIFTFVSFMIFRKHKLPAILLLTAFIIGYIRLFIYLDEPMIWYDTLLCFPLGFLYSYLKPYIEKFVFKNDIVWIGCVTAVTLLFIYGYRNRANGISKYEVYALTFVLLVVLLTMKINISNNILEYFGKHVFSIYMLQRLPMKILSKAFIVNLPYLYVVSCFVITLFISALFDYMTDKISKKIFLKK